VTDLVKAHDHALELTEAIVTNVRPDQLARPTPCAEFDVRTLLRHMIAGNERFAAVAMGDSIESRPVMSSFDGDDLAPLYRASATAVSAAWREPGVLDRRVQLPIGEVPGEVALAIHTVETVVHGWDVAKATNQPTEIPPELCAVAWEASKDIGDNLRGAGRPFGPAVPVPPGASDSDRLVAWLGRHP
jgi:uncharacterized protein (TIGR03086 family)